MNIKYCFIILWILAGSAATAQRKFVPIPKPNTGTESYKVTSKESGFKISTSKLKIPPVQTSGGIFEFINTGVYTVYDLQSNAVPNQIWQDPINPLKVHATCMYSTEPGFATRQCAYLFSDNGGDSWTNFGDVPSSGRAGFPSITGFPNVTGGSPTVIANQNTTNGTNARTKINYDAGPGFGVFTEIDPGLVQGFEGLYPRVLGLPNNKIVFVTSVNGQGLPATNVVTNITQPGTFSGYSTYPGGQPEGYSLALSPTGIVGHAYIGANDGINNNDVFYRTSSNDGLTWSAPVLVWDFNETTDSMGCLRGISMVFGSNNEPYIVFNLGKMTMSGMFDPESPSEIRVWTPSLDDGIPFIIADQSNVPFFPNKGNVGDAFIPVCRPAIGRASSGSLIFISFVATTGQYSPVDTSSYYAGWFAYTYNNGNSWSVPQRMTPQNPLRDWRFISVAPVNFANGNIQMMALSDSLPGSHVNGAEIGTGEFFVIRFPIYIGGGPGPPLVPVLTSPPAGSINVSLTPLLDWNNVSTASAYNLHVSRNASFTNLIINRSSISASEFQIPVGALNNDSIYYWRVCGSNHFGTGAWSVISNFRTLITNIQSIGTEIPDKFFIYNNYPNPFNPLTKIQFDIPRTSPVKLSVYDNLGREVRTLVNEVLSPGKYETEFIADDLSSGIYFYRIEAGDFVNVKRMIFLK